jgi:ligand-binding sensor domain-containing protein/AraC-like DNA-binding protein
MQMEKRNNFRSNIGKRRLRQLSLFLKSILPVLLFFLILTASLLPLDPDSAIDNYSILIRTTKTGLPQDSVYAIVQDRSGYMWFGTDEGTVRSDGVRFDLFNRKNTKEIKNNTITCFLAAGDGALWLGTFGGGVAVFKDGGFINYNREHGLPSDFIWTITEDRAKNIWIGTTGGGLARFKDNIFKTYTVKDGLADNIVKVVLEDSSKKLWIGTENGLTVMDKSKTRPVFKTFHVQDGLADNVVTAIFEDSKKNLWIGTENGLNRKSNGRFYSYTRTADYLTNNIVHAIHEDKDKNLWIATERGLLRMQGDKVERLTLSGGLSDNSLLTICEDREGNLWVGTSGKGVNMLHNSKFILYTVKEGLSEDTIKAIYEDENGSLWVGTNGGGLNRIRNGKFRTYTTRNGLNSDFVNSVWGNGKGKLWIGTTRGLNLYENGVFTRLLPDRGNDALTPTVTSIYEDIEKNLWVGTFGVGLYLQKEGNFYRISAGRGLENNFVLSLAEDNDGNIWVGTNNGLTRISRGGGTVEDIFAEENHKTYSLKDGLSDDMIYDIYIDGDGVLWIGTNGGGLNRLKNDTITVYNSDVGLFSEVIYRILEDGNGNLWMSSNKGIFKTAKQDLDKFAAGEIASIHCMYFQEDDGLLSSVCAGGFQPAGWKGKDGILYFPTNRGIAAINPEKLKINEVKPPVIIEKVAADGVNIDIKNISRLPAGTRDVEFNFTALSFTAPKKVKFSYQLSGYENRWHETANRDPVVYKGLTPGRYKFKVFACNNDNIWNYKGATYSFSIKYKFFQEIRFQFLFIFLLLFLLVFIYRYRKNKGKREKYSASTLESWKSQRYLQKILNLMEEEKPYRDPEITVEKLSKLLAVSEKHLSQILNENLQLNFNNFINKYRVEEAQRKIVDPKEKDFVILKIAYDVGFNSKSAFNAAFKKFTLMSPSEYRKINS